MVVDLSNYGEGDSGSEVWIFHATGANNQQWASGPNSSLMSESDKIPKGHKLCIDAQSKNFGSQKWCNTSLSIDERVEDMVSRMTLAEKIPNLNTGGSAIPSLGLDSYNWYVHKCERRKLKGSDSIFSN